MDYGQNLTGSHKSALLSATKKARLKTNPPRVRFAEAENGSGKLNSSDVINSLQEKLGISAIEYFALVLQDVTSPTNNNLTLLLADDNISQIASEPASHNLKCIFRLHFVPFQPSELLTIDSIAFDYFYMQCCNDVVEERHASHLKYDVLLRLSALQIHQHASASNLQKVNVKLIEKECGLEKFVSASLLTNAKKKDVRRVISHVLLKLVVKGLENTQAKLEYIRLLYDNLANIGGRMFYVTVVEEKRDHNILIGAKFGLAKVVNLKMKTVRQLADFDEISSITVIQPERKNDKIMYKVKISLINSPDSESINLVMIGDVMKNFVGLLDGYCRIKSTNKCSRLKIVEEEKEEEIYEKTVEVPEDWNYEDSEDKSPRSIDFTRLPVDNVDKLRKKEPEEEPNDKPTTTLLDLSPIGAAPLASPDVSSLSGSSLDDEVTMKDDSDDTTACTVTPTQSPVETETEDADTHSARLVRAVDDFKPKNLDQPQSFGLLSPAIDGDSSNVNYYNRKLFCDGGQYIDPEIIDLTAIPPPKTPDEPELDNIDFSKLAAPSAEFSDDLSIVQDLPENIKQRIDQLVMEDEDIKTEHLEAYDAFILERSNLKDQERESGFDSDSDNDSPVDSSIFLSDVDAFIAKNRVPSPPKDASKFTFSLDDLPLPVLEDTKTLSDIAIDALIVPAPPPREDIVDPPEQFTLPTSPRQIATSQTDKLQSSSVSKLRDEFECDKNGTSPAKSIPDIIKSTVSIKQRCNKIETTVNDEQSKEPNVKRCSSFEKKQIKVVQKVSQELQAKMTEELNKKLKDRPSDMVSIPVPPPLPPSRSISVPDDSTIDKNAIYSTFKPQNDVENIYGINKMNRSVVTSNLTRTKVPPPPPPRRGSVPNSPNRVYSQNPFCHVRVLPVSHSRTGSEPVLAQTEQIDNNKRNSMEIEKSVIDQVIQYEERHHVPAHVPKNSRSPNPSRKAFPFIKRRTSASSVNNYAEIGDFATLDRSPRSMTPSPAVQRHHSSSRIDGNRLSNSIRNLMDSGGTLTRGKKSKKSENVYATLNYPLLQNNTPSPISSLLEGNDAISVIPDRPTPDFSTFKRSTPPMSRKTPPIERPSRPRSDSKKSLESDNSCESSEGSPARTLDENRSQTIQDLLDKTYSSDTVLSDIPVDIEILVRAVNGAVDAVNAVYRSDDTNAFNACKEALVTEARTFVTHSKQVLSSATSSERKLIDTVQIGMKTLAKLVQLATATISTLTSPARAHELGSRVKEVARSYRTTVNSARPAAGLPLHHPLMKLLVRQAGSLAASLTALMKTLKVLDAS
ncbi:DgyrCDS3777 [Dimorphilus gyrociliatus]|uniref:DgyrCDS3777 n=1 Tax=Dimorphilus gyrociliatus TaxID=2664684 RepID=A0A7I8VEZ1_9ANNE|nr:DgyrCDS3777 [Dimorphilus gyrociliatus]